MDDLDGVVAEFLVEADDDLDRYDRDVLTLERDAGDAQALAGAFRSMHTIKGTCGLLGFDRLETVSHAAESLLARVRDGVLPITADIVGALLAAGDTIRALLAAIAETGSEHDVDVREVHERLASLSRSEDGATHDWGPGEGGTLGEILLARGVASPAQLLAAEAAQDRGDPRRIGEILVAQGAATPEDVAAALEIQGHSRVASAVDSSVRVEVARLEGLLALVDDLAGVSAELSELAGQRRDRALGCAAERVARTMTELRVEILAARTQPIGTIWRRYPRLVRDLALACGTWVNLEVQGADTELDASALDAVRDACTHLVRNAVDHGVEPPDQRRALGKRAEGRVGLCAHDDGVQVTIEVSDDGAGIDPTSILASAVTQGALTGAQAAQLDDRGAVALIFEPGISTTEGVTSVSGRGVGMDVVRTSIERVGGNVEVRSALGAGTTFTLTIPRHRQPS